jgi:hypothetical protein
MAVIAGLIAIEKTVPTRPIATYGVAAILLGLGVLLFVAPDAIPSLTIPGTHAMPLHRMDNMDQMQMGR